MEDLPIIECTMDVPSMLAIVGCIELAIQHPEMPEKTRLIAGGIARNLALCLYQRTDILTPELIRAWQHAGILPENLEDVCRQ